MKWLILFGSLGAAAIAFQILVWERRSGRHLAPLRQAAMAIVAVVLLGGAVYSAHLLGIFSIPLVVITFVPVGATVRWLILATRVSRQREAEARAAAFPATRHDLFLRAISLPLFVTMALAVVLLGLVVGTIVGPH